MELSPHLISNRKVSSSNSTLQTSTSELGIIDLFCHPGSRKVTIIMMLDWIAINIGKCFNRFVTTTEDLFLLVLVFDILKLFFNFSILRHRILCNITKFERIFELYSQRVGRNSNGYILHFHNGSCRKKTFNNTQHVFMRDMLSSGWLC